MANVNKVILIGNLTRDPQLSYTPGNTAVCEWGMAVNRKFKTASGEDKEEVLFVDVTAFARLAEVVNQYMTKGRPLYVEGRLQLQQWTAKDGAKRSKHSIIAESVQFLGSRESGGGSSRGSRPDDRDNDAVYDDGPPPMGDDIPF